MKKKKFTWGDFKKIVNKLPPDILKREVIIWGEESGTTADGIEVLKEDYVFDGDEGCAPKSEIKKSMSKEEWKEQEDEYYTVHPKGMAIIYVREYLKKQE